MACRSARPAKDPTRMGHHRSPRRQPVWRSTSWRKWRNLALLATSELLAMTLWFSASTVAPQLTAEWHLSGNQQAWLTMSVQLGFVGGALLSAVFNLADRL